MQRKNFIVLFLCLHLIGALIVAGLTLGVVNAHAAAQEVKIALAYPLSGAFSRNGNLTVQGIKAAISWVNEQGGIKALGGAKLVPVVADTGSKLEGAASAMERLGRDPAILMAMGSWSSSLTMASTEVSERSGIPHFSISYSDGLNSRGFKWGFYLTPPSSALTGTGLPRVLELAKSAGHTVKTVMPIGDNTASAKDFLNSAKRIFSDLGVKVLSEETWSMGNLSDATPIMQKVKAANPDMVLFHASAIAEAQMCLMKKKELSIKIPFIATGGYAADPSFRMVGPEILEGCIALTGCFPHKLTPQDWVKRSLEQCKKEYADEPWVGQELNFGWIMVPVMAEVLELAKSRDRNVIRETASKLDIHDGLATRATVMQGVAFGENGRLAQKYQGTLFVQWQSGVPRTVFPSNLALSKPEWIVGK